MKLVYILSTTVLTLGLAICAQYYLEQHLSRHLATTAAPPERKCELGPDSTAAAVQRFSRFLTFKTLSDSDTADHVREGHHGEFQALHDFLRTAYPRVYERLTVERVGLGDHSLLFTWPGTDPSLKPVLFISHIDVVPVAEGTESHWTHPPFSGAVADGYVWGRGALDVKVSVTALLEAVDGLLPADGGWSPSRTVYLAFGHDEEVSGYGGAAEIAKLLEARGVSLEVVVDEGGVVLQDGIRGLLDAPLALVATAEKMYTSISVELTSSGGHSSMPPIDGSDIASQVARLVAWVAKHPLPARMQPPMTQFLSAVAPHLSSRLKQLALLHADRWPLNVLVAKAFTGSSRETAALVRTTTAVTRLHAHTADNVLPQSGVINFNMRSPPGVPREELMQYLQQAVQRSGVLNASLAVSAASHFGPVPGVVPDTDPYFLLLKQAIQELWRFDGRPVAVAPYLLTGGTDSKHYAHMTAHGILRFVPYSVNKTAGDLGRIHGTDERVSVADYARAICTYSRVLQLFAGPPAAAAPAA